MLSVGAPDRPVAQLAPTPTHDALPRRIADFPTLGAALDYAATGARGLNFHDPRGKLVRAYPYAEMRADALDKIGTEIIARKEELGTLLSREEGKTRVEGIGEAARAGAIFKFFAQECLRLRGDKLASVRPNLDIEITREPVGVVAAIIISLINWLFGIILRPQKD